MRFFKHATPQDVSREVAKKIAAAIRENPRTVLGLASGSTPVGLYHELIRYHREEGLDFSQVTTFNLDEYYGLEPDHPHSYHTFMKEELLDHINVPEKNIHIPNGKVESIAAFCEQYERAIAEAGGIDIQILGVGTNGHVGFNEPADELQPYTHFVQLAPSTIDANARFFPSRDDVPRSAITMGMSTILGARRIYLLALGTTKAPIIKKIMQSGITTRIPASLLRLHRDAEVHVDAEAAQLL